MALLKMNIFKQIHLALPGVELADKEWHWRNYTGSSDLQNSSFAHYKWAHKMFRVFQHNTLSLKCHTNTIISFKFDNIS